uniref:Putative ovule protein n=1 Tax=Solanum chacoense TaxID=4108 RepID=A0A0V0GW04_SOLCH
MRNHTSTLRPCNEHPQIGSGLASAFPNSCQTPTYKTLLPPPPAPFFSAINKQNDPYLIYLPFLNVLSSIT